MRSSGGAATARPTTPRPSARAAVSSLTLKNLVLSHRDGPTPPVRRACRVEVRARHLRARARAVCATSRQKERRLVSPSSALECGHATVVVASGQSVVRARLDTELSIAQVPDLARDRIVGVAAEPHLKWKTYCATVLELARRCEATVVLTLGALLAEVPHTRPVRLVGGATDAELAARLGIRPTRYEGPTGIVGALSTICRDQGFTTASLWANVPHYISGIENPKATLALVRRVLPLLGATLDLVDLEDAGRQFDQNLTEIVRQNAKIANYVKKLESRDTEEPSAEPGRGSDLPPASELVAEIEQFLRQQRPE